MSFFAELKRRHVVRAGVAYLALAWLLIEVAGTLFPGFGIPDWAFRFVVIVLALGFVPVLVFSWAYEITPEGVKREQDVVRDEASAIAAARRMDKLTIGIVVVALAFIVADRFWLSPRLGQPDVASQEPAEQAEMPADEGADLPPSSIAVLPFANRSDNPKDVFFVDGIHDDLLTFISQIGSIKTISRTSVMKYRDSTLSIPEIARELAVATVLEGSVQRAGDQVRINVQLIDARTDAHLWSQIYDRELTASNVFAIQSEIAGSIAEALRAELTPHDRERIASVPTENLEALEAYFLGRQKMATRRVADLAEATEHFEQAVALDPEFALAYVGLAYSTALYWNYAQLRSEELLVEGRLAAQHALRLDPGLAEAHTAEGLLEWYGREFEKAEEAFKRAIRLNPNEVQAHQWLGHMLGSRGRVEEALEYSRKAVLLDPKSAIILADYGDVLNWAERYEEAVEQFRQAVAIEPQFSKGYRRLGDLAIASGSLVEGISAYREAQALEPENWRILRSLASIFLALGDDQRAEDLIRMAVEKAASGEEQLGVSLGRLYLYRGDDERAMTHIGSAWAGNPDDQIALYYLANHDLAEGDITGALDRYRKAFPGLLGDEPAVDGPNHVVAIQLAVIYSRSGEAELAERLLDLAWQVAESFEPRHYGDEAAIYAMRGNRQAALDALRSMGRLEQIQSWREFVVGHPALQVLFDDPEFQALNDEFEAEMARQLAQVREMEASGELPPLPEG